MIEEVISLFIRILKMVIAPLPTRPPMEEQTRHFETRRQARSRFMEAKFSSEKKSQLLEEAYDLYQEATAFLTTPDQMADTYCEFGEVCAELGWYNEAIEKWRKALFYKPMHEDALTHLAYLNLQLAKMTGGRTALRFWRDAKKCLKKLIRCAPWNAGQYRHDLEECQRYIAKQSWFSKVGRFAILSLEGANTLMLAREVHSYGV